MSPHAHPHAGPPHAHDHHHDHGGPAHAQHHHEHHEEAGHGHHHGPGAHHHGSGRWLPLALLLTLGFSAIEALAGWWAGSLALLGDAGHMLTDSLALGLATLAARLSRRPATLRHSYGLQRVEALSALLNGLFMLALVIALGWHAAARLIAPQPVAGATVTVVAATGLMINLAVAWLLTRGEADLNTRAALLHVLGDLLGSVAALAAGLVIHFTGWTPIDPLLSMLIAGLILASTLGLLRQVLHTLLEGVPEHLSLQQVGQAMAAVPGVRSVHDLHIWSLNSSRPALSAHVVIDDPARWPRVLLALRLLLEKRFHIEHLTLQPELPGDGQVVLLGASGKPAADQGD